MHVLQLSIQYVKVKKLFHNKPAAFKTLNYLFSYYAFLCFSQVSLIMIKPINFLNNERKMAN